MLLTIVSWLLLYLITSVLGFSILRQRQSDQFVNFSQTEIILAGLTAVVVVVQAASILMPANFYLVGALVLLVLLINGRFANRPLWAAVGSLRRLTKQPLFWLLAGAVLVFAIRAPANSDSGLYHIPAIRWYERFRAIPGLGNLHGRLAFNSSFFVISAAFGFTSIVGQTVFALNSFVFLVFGAYVIGQLRRPESMPGLRMLHVVLLGLALYYLLYQVSAPTPDLWATLLPMFVFLFWLNGAPNTHPARFLLLIALCLLCLTVKLGTVLLLLLLPMLLITHWRSLDLRQSLRLVGLGSLLVGPWLIRNVILSGYLIYPFPALDLFAPDWKIPLPAVHYEQDYVTFWGRFHVFEAYLDPAKLAWPLTRWVPMWWDMQGNPETLSYYKLNRPLFAAACLSPLVLIVQVIRAGVRPVRLWAAYVVVLGGFLFWFIKAPEIRFGYAFIWLTALLPWTPLLGRLPLAQSSRLGSWALGALLLFLTAKMINRENPLTAQTLVLPEWEGYRDQQAKGLGYRSHRTQSGLEVLMPEPAPLEQRCFDIEQPCSPYFFEDLEKRGVTLESGFRRRSLRQLIPLPGNKQANDAQSYYPHLR